MKKRLDLLLVERGLFATRTKAQAALMAGQVLLEGKPAPKAGTPVPDDSELEILSPSPYVSRGGLKLEAALDHWKDVGAKGRVCLDVGSSTGGFTDCLLQRGAAKVYAVDVGTAQLHDKLKADPRVVSKERTHARDMKPSWFEPRPTLAVIDVSFISVTQVLPFALACLQPPWEVLALVKPQFELEPKLAPKGVVRDAAARERALKKAKASAAEAGAAVVDAYECPVHGPKGNIETFLRLRSAAP
jgi:23S rRNA (cytidine1920-2'-O)/16S rRNA (cytidine1409-2'-O)-methyltransferase